MHLAHITHITRMMHIVHVTQNNHPEEQVQCVLFDPLAMGGEAASWCPSDKCSMVGCSDPYKSGR